MQRTQTVQQATTFHGLRQHAATHGLRPASSHAQEPQQCDGIAGGGAFNGHECVFAKQREGTQRHGSRDTARRVYFVRAALEA